MFRRLTQRHPPVLFHNLRHRNDTNFTYATRQQDIKKMEKLLEVDPTLVNKGISEGTFTNTPIYIATQNELLPAVEFLANRGAVIDSNNYNNYTPLALAVDKGYTNIVEYLISKGANIHSLSIDGSTPLFKAALKKNAKMARLLLDNGADVNNGTTSGNRTPLHAAAQHGDVELVRLLLDRGADVNKINDKNDSPLIVAALYNSLEVVSLLLDRGADITNGNKSGYTALHMAIQYNTLEVVRLLLDRGSDVNKPAHLGNFSLHIAYNSKPEVVQLLLDRGADINKVNRSRITPLHIASKFGTLEVVRVFVENGAIITQNIIDDAKTNTIKRFLQTAMGVSHDTWKGFTKSDLDKFNSMFDSDNPAAMSSVSVCPVCLKYVERSEACNYMSHNCSTSGYFHEELYNKYKNESDNIYWCTVCGRICLGHRHYVVDDVNGPIPELLHGREPFAKDCRVDGGGGVEEKITRFRKMHETAVELQGKIGTIDAMDAMNKLVEDMWNSPMYMNPQVVEQIKRNKKFNIPLNAFPNNTATTPNTSVKGAPVGSFESPEVLTGVENSIMANDSEPVIRFKHKNARGVMTSHELVVNKDTVLGYLETSGTKQNRCFEPACNGFLWPEEIEQAFANTLIAPSVTDDDKAKLVTYKERFYRNYTGGRRVVGNNRVIFESALNPHYAMSRRPRQNRTLKNKARVRHIISRKHKMASN